MAARRAIEPWLRARGYELDWYDTDWLAATLALVAAALLGLAVRRRLDRGHLAGAAPGRWAGGRVSGFLVLGLGLRMTPPRGDNWAGCLGMTLGADLCIAVQTGLAEVARAGLVCGFIGGIGFAAASMLKLVEVTSGYETNWHSILEQTTGLFNGIGIAVAMAGLAARVAPMDQSEEADDQSVRWAKPLAVGFVLLGITYLNLRKNVAEWVAGPRDAGGDVRRSRLALVRPGVRCLVAVGLAVLMVRHMRRPLAVVPASPLGQGQVLYLVLLWCHGHRQLRACPGLVRGSAAGDRGGDLLHRDPLCGACS